MSHKRLHLLLETAVADFQTQFHREQDPVSWPHRYADRADREVAAFLSALLAYGNVATILGSLEHVFAALGPHPAQGLERPDLSARLKDFRHRFTTGTDIEIVCAWLRHVFDRHGSLEALFELGVGRSPRESLARFVENLHSIALGTRLERIYRARERSLHYLISNPNRGSACKRLNLFLRWVVRPSGPIDLGLWRSYDPALLMIPLDTHVLRIVRELHWVRSEAATWKSAEATTARLRHFCPSDPVRYDFALCHLSMSGLSVATYNEKLERRSVYQEGPPGEL